jgi:uncharacterized membrane protein YsdA (DUF1294 family)
VNEPFNVGQRRGRVSAVALVSLLALLLLPALAATRLPTIFDLRFVSGYAILISAVTYFLYGRDKGRALAGGWRTRESTLHLVELLGGWPGAFFAQRVLRHKISKLSYQLKFWMIVALHQFAAFDFIHSWQHSRKTLLLLF